MLERKLASEIDAYIDSRRDDLIKDLTELVSFPSVSVPGSPMPHPFGDECAKVLDAAIAMAQRHNMQTVNGNYWYGVATRGEGKHSIGIFSHLDVVEVDDQWIYPPFQVTEKDGWLIGRGVDDDKNAAVLGMYVNDTLNHFGLANNTRLVLYLGQSEEKGMQDLDKYLSENREPDFSMVPDFLFPVSVGEGGMVRTSIKSEVLDEFTRFVGGVKGARFPVNASIVYTGSKCEELEAKASEAQKISCEKTENGLLISAEGFAGSSMFAPDKISGIYVLADFLANTGLLTEKDASILSGVAAINAPEAAKNLGIEFHADKFKGGNLGIGCNFGWDEEGAIVFNYRANFPEGAKSSWIQAETEKFCAAHHLSLGAVQITEPSIVDAEREEIKICTDAWNDVSGQQIPPQFGGGTYARKLKNGVGFGPKTRISPTFLPKGHGMLHSPDEATNIQCLLDAVKTYVRVVVELDDYYSKL